MKKTKSQKENTRISNLFFTIWLLVIIVLFIKYFKKTNRDHPIQIRINTSNEYPVLNMFDSGGIEFRMITGKGEFNDVDGEINVPIKEGNDFEAQSIILDTKDFKGDRITISDTSTKQLNYIYFEEGLYEFTTSITVKDILSQGHKIIFNNSKLVNDDITVENKTYSILTQNSLVVTDAGSVSLSPEEKILEYGKSLTEIYNRSKDDIYFLSFEMKEI